MLDTEFLLSEDTKRWLALITKPSKLHPSYYRILVLLREMNTSPSLIAEQTGLQLTRVRARLQQMRQYGYVEVVETLSDKTQIWGLTELLRKPDVISHPSEALVVARRSRQKTDGPTVIDPGVPKAWSKPDGVVRPRNPVKVDRIDTSSLKQYEAKTNK